MHVTSRVAIIMVLSSAALAGESTLRPAWKCLPENTAFAGRIANGQAVVDAFRSQTKLGAVVFGEDRIQHLQSIIKEHMPDQWTFFEEQMGEYSLTPDDFPQLLTGASGFAVVVDTEGTDPALIGLGWFEPGHDLAARVWNAVGKLIEEQEDKTHPIERVDIELEGQPVMQLTLPDVSVESDALFEPPPSFESLSEPEQEEALERWHQEWEQSQREVVRFTHLLLTHIDGHLLVAMTLNPKQELAQDDYLGRLTGTMARFLAAQHDDGDGFTARVGSTELVYNALPQVGVPCLEVYGDAQSLINLANAESQPGAAQVISALGIDRLGTFALRIALENSLLRSGWCISAPIPRAGILALVNQPSLDPVPALWVPADVISYTHVSADLGKFYTHIKNVILSEFAEEAQWWFALVEGQVMAFARSDLATMLSSMGHQHAVLTFEPGWTELAPADDGSLQPGLPTSAPFAMSRMAIVWQLQDEVPWTNMLQGLAGLVQPGSGPLTATEEQGFRGYRFQGSVEGGIVHGNGHLVFALGEGVLEKTLSSMNNPPRGEDALRTGELFEHAQSLIQLQPGINFQIVNGNRNAKILCKMIRTMIGASMRNLPHDELDRTLLVRQLQEMIPNEDEAEGMFGAVTGVIYVNDHGIVGQNVSELPAP